MRRFMVVACVLAVAMLSTNAHAAAMYAGLKGGVNMADLSGDRAPENSSMRTGFAGGGFIGWDFGQFGIRPELLYIQKGGEGDFVSPGDDHTHESIIKLDYVELPVLFTVKFPAGEKLAFNLFAGPTFALMTTSEVEVPSHNEAEDLDPHANFEFGGTIGGGIEYMLSSMSLLADVRYGYGVTSVIGDYAGEEFDIQNRGIGIMAGVSFPLGPKP